MKINPKHIDRGARLKQVVAENGISITQLVRKTGISRSSYYNHIADRFLPIDILLKYGQVLKHDFLVDFPELSQYIVNENAMPYAQLSEASTIEEAVKQRDIWKEKYFEMLEKYHQLREELDARKQLKK